jgi:hypothetical protein
MKTKYTYAHLCTGALKDAYFVLSTKLRGNSSAVVLYDPTRCFSEAFICVSAQSLDPAKRWG